MHAFMDMWFLLLSVAFTILAGFLTAALFRREKPVLGKTGVNTAEESFPPCAEKEQEVFTVRVAAARARARAPDFCSQLLIKAMFTYRKFEH